MNKFVRAWYKNTAHNQKVLRELGYAWGFDSGDETFKFDGSKYLYTNPDRLLTYGDSLTPGCPKGSQVEEYLNNSNSLSKERILDAISVIKEVNGKLPPTLWITVGKSLIKQGVINNITTSIEDVSKVDRLVESLISHMNKNKEKAKLQKDLDDLMFKAEEIKEQIRGM